MQDQMQRISFFSQSIVRDMAFEEMSGEAAGATDVDEAFFTAPFAVPTEFDPAR
jgi:hypothetical protein